MSSNRAPKAKPHSVLPLHITVPFSNSLLYNTHQVIRTAAKTVTAHTELHLMLMPVFPHETNHKNFTRHWYHLLHVNTFYFSLKGYNIKNQFEYHNYKVLHLLTSVKFIKMTVTRKPSTWLLWVPKPHLDMYSLYFAKFLNLNVPSVCKHYRACMNLEITSIRETFAGKWLCYSMAN